MLAKEYAKNMPLSPVISADRLIKQAKNEERVDGGDTWQALLFCEVNNRACADVVDQVCILLDITVEELEWKAGERCRSSDEIDDEIQKYYGCYR